jgi:hypothetical protein
MINNPKDQPESMLIRWIAYLSLFFHLKVVHVPRTENTIADALTRRESGEDGSVESSDKENEIEETFTTRSQMFSKIPYTQIHLNRIILSPNWYLLKDI